MDTLPLFDLNDKPSEKFCKGCQNFYPATLEFFPSDKKGKNGLCSRCRVCRRAIAKKYRDKPEKHAERLAKTNEWRSRPEVKEHVREYNRAYMERPGMKEHRLERSRSAVQKARSKAYHSRPEVRERMRLYYRQPHQLAKRREYGRNYAHRPEIKERQRLNGIAYRSAPDFQEAKQEWRKEYNRRPIVRARNHEYRHNRRARLRNATGTHTYEEIKQQYARQKGKCYYCQCDVPCDRYHVDHVIPLSRGGTNDISNIVIACSKCNLSKHAKLPHEFLKGGRLL